MTTNNDKQQKNNDKQQKPKKMKAQQKKLTTMDKYTLRFILTGEIASNRKSRELFDREEDKKIQDLLDKEHEELKMLVEKLS